MYESTHPEQLDGEKEVNHSAVPSSITGSLKDNLNTEGSSS